jgi:hypothetical protein
MAELYLPVQEQSRFQLRKDPRGWLALCGFVQFERAKTGDVKMNCGNGGCDMQIKISR